MRAHPCVSEWVVGDEYYFRSEQGKKGLKNKLVLCGKSFFPDNTTLQHGYSRAQTPTHALAVAARGHCTTLTHRAELKLSTHISKSAANAEFYTWIRGKTLFYLLSRTAALVSSVNGNWCHRNFNLSPCSMKWYFSLIWAENKEPEASLASLFTCVFVSGWILSDFDRDMFNICTCQCGLTHFSHTGKGGTHLVRRRKEGWSKPGEDLGERHKRSF